MYCAIKFSHFTASQPHNGCVGNTQKHTLPHILHSRLFVSDCGSSGSASAMLFFASCFMVRLGHSALPNWLGCDCLCRVARMRHIWIIVIIKYKCFPFHLAPHCHGEWRSEKMIFVMRPLNWRAITALKWRDLTLSPFLSLFDAKQWLFLRSEFEISSNPNKSTVNALNYLCSWLFFFSAFSLPTFTSLRAWFELRFLSLSIYVCWTQAQRLSYRIRHCLSSLSSKKNER